MCVSWTQPNTHTQRLCVCLDIIQYFQYRPQFRIVWFVCKVIVISVYPFTQNNSTPTGQIWLLRVFVAKFRGCFGWGHAALSLSLSPTFTSSVNIGSMKKKRSRSECERSILTYCIKPVKVSISCRHNRFTLHSQIAAPHKTTDSHVTVQHCQRVLRFLLKSQNVLTQNQISSYASVTNTVLGVQWLLQHLSFDKLICPTD